MTMQRHTQYKKWKLYFVSVSLHIAQVGAILMNLTLLSLDKSDEPKWW